jgi:hypothetical protein
MPFVDTSPCVPAVKALTAGKAIAVDYPLRETPG